MTKDVLQILKEKSSLKPTTLMGAANLNVKNGKEILSGLDARGFVLIEMDNKYVITAKGKQFLENLSKHLEEQKELSAQMS